MRSSGRAVVRIGKGRSGPVDDLVAVEAPVEFRLEDVPIAVLMRTPGDDLALARGFALTEGILLSPDELERIEALDDGDRYRLITRSDVRIDPERFRRNTYTTSSCGVCGKASIDAVLIAARPLPVGPMLAEEQIVDYPTLLRTTQTAFDETGGLHGVAILGPGGEILSAAEDIGRHNAVDKAIGSIATTRWPLGEVVLVVSGRISFEIAQKAAVAGIPMVAGISAPSSLAVDLATDIGMTLIGFLRQGGGVVYSGRERIIGLPTAGS